MFPPCRQVHRFLNRNQLSLWLQMSFPPFSSRHLLRRVYWFSGALNAATRSIWELVSKREAITGGAFHESRSLRRCFLSLFLQIYFPCGWMDAQFQIAVLNYRLPPMIRHSRIAKTDFRARRHQEVFFDYAMNTIFTNFDIGSIGIRDSACYIYRCLVSFAQLLEFIPLATCSNLQ